MNIIVIQICHTKKKFSIIVHHIYFTHKAMRLNPIRFYCALFIVTLAEQWQQNNNDYNMSKSMYITLFLTVIYFGAHRFCFVLGHAEHLLDCCSG